MKIHFKFFFFKFSNSNLAGSSRKNATNNVAEIQAATVAIQQAIRLGIKKLCVVTDSNNVFDAVAGHLEQWKRNGWVSLYEENKNQPIKDRKDFEKLDKALHADPQMLIRFQLIEAHSGNENHNAADRLAEHGAQLHYKNRCY